MKTNRLIGLMALLVLLVLGAAVGFDQMRTRKADHAIMEMKLANAEGRAKSAKVQGEVKETLRDLDELKLVIGELGTLKARLDEVKARTPETLEGNRQKGMDLIDVMERVKLAEERLDHLKGKNE